MRVVGGGAVRVVGGGAVRVVGGGAVSVVSGGAVRVVGEVWRGSGRVDCAMLVVGVARGFLRLKYRVVRVQ